MINQNSDKQTINILIIDDSADDVIVISEAFKESKLKVNTNVINNGIDALKYLLKKDNYKNSISPDLIILDLNLPVKNGNEILKEIKKEDILKDIPVIILSTSDSKKDMETCYENGADFYLTKPFKFDDYIKIIHKIEEFWQSWIIKKKDTINEIGNPFSDKKEVLILLIEDNPDDIIIMKEMFGEIMENSIENKEIFLDEANTIKDALKKIEEKAFDVILLDLSLPDSKGISTIDKFIDIINTIPVIVLTGLDDVTIALKAIQKGAQDYLVKGKIESTLLVKAIQYSIERNKLIKTIHDLTLYDDLTKIHNRRGFFHLLEQQIKISQRKKEKCFLFYIDLNDFKVINDTYGHTEGDIALKDITAILKNTFRDSDIIARIGGDEFVVFFTDTDIKSEDIIKNRLLNNVTNFNYKNKKEYKMSISIGISEYNPEKPCSIDELLAYADSLMYEDKKSKKGLNK